MRVSLGVTLATGLMSVAIWSMNAVSTPAEAADWSPSSNVTILVPASPGGGFDRAARTIQRVIEDNHLVDAPITVVNKPGASGLISWNELKKHKGDGSYLCISTPNILSTHITGKSPLTYTDFTPLAQLYTEYPAFIVTADSPYKSGKDLIAALKKNIDSVSFSVGSGLGNANHLSLVLAADAAGLNPKKMKTAVFKGSSKALAALLGHHIDVAIMGLTAARSSYQAGKVRILAVAAPRRLAGGVFSDVPTWKEQGIDSVLPNWRGVMGSPDMSKSAVAYWNDVFSKMVKTDEWRKEAEKNSWDVDYMDSEQSQKFLADQYKKLHRALNGIGMAKK